MAHELNETNGKVSMMYYGEEPWHGLGQKLDKPATSWEAIEQAGLDFVVDKRPVFCDLGSDNGTMNMHHIPGKFATVRMDTGAPLGVVGKQYTVLQNKDAFGFFDEIVGEGEAIYHTAGALYKGQKIWILAKLPETMTLKGGDEIEEYLLLMNSHDGSGAVNVKFTPIRVVCSNTLNMALRSGERGVKVRHTAGMTTNGFTDIRETLGLIKNSFRQVQGVYNTLALSGITQKWFTEYLDGLFPINKKAKFATRQENIRLKVTELFQGAGKGADLPSARGTKWGAYNLSLIHI